MSLKVPPRGGLPAGGRAGVLIDLAWSKADVEKREGQYVHQPSSCCRTRGVMGSRSPGDSSPAEDARTEAADALLALLTRRTFSSRSGGRTLGPAVDVAINPLLPRSCLLTSTKKLGQDFFSRTPRPFVHPGLPKCYTMSPKLPSREGLPNYRRPISIRTSAMSQERLVTPLLQAVDFDFCLGFASQCFRLGQWRA